MAIAWLRGLGSVGAMVMTVLLFANTAPAAANPGTPMPGMRVVDENMSCTASFAAHGDDGSYYFLTSGHCDAHNGSPWTYGQNVPLGTMTVSENDGADRDAAIIRVDPSVGVPSGDVGGRPVHGVYGADEIKVGMPFCKLGAVTGETCGVVTKVNDGMVEASVFSLNGDSGSPGFVKNLDGTVGAVGILTGSPDGDDNTSYFILVSPLLEKWGLRLLP